MTIYRSSKGNFEQHEEVEIFTKKYISNIGGKASITCGGQKYFNEPDKAPEAALVEDTPLFISGSWSEDYEGTVRVATDTTDQKGYRAELEDFVYFQLKVNKSIPVGTAIPFELYDKNILLGIDNLAFDDKITNEDNGKDIPVTGKGVVRDCRGADYNKITLKLYLNPAWNTQLEDDKGSFKDGCLDLYFNWTYLNQLYTVDKDTLILSVYYHRDLFISAAYPSKYKFPEIIDSKTNEFIIFLGNEGGDIAGTIDSKLEKFYVIRVRILSQYKFEGGTNIITKKMYEERYNLRTGESSNKNLFQVTESVEFKIKNSKTITNLESTIEKKIKRNFSDYFTIVDISKLGIRGAQEALNVLGYLDLFGDLQDAIAGRGLSTYDTIGLGTTAAEIALKVTAAQETKIGILTAEEIALIALPKWITPVTFGLAVFEETITKPFVSDIMQTIEGALVERMELAKKKGFNMVREVASERQMTGYYELIENISQQKHDEVFAGKIKTLKELNINNFEYHFYNPSKKTYSYLLRLVKKENTEEYDYKIETIFI